METLYKDYFFSTNQDKIITYIKNMNYQDFLNTPYWVAIANQVKYEAGYRCSLCNSEYNLRTHHKTYSRHGEELSRWDKDLICLCDNCHKTFHNK